MLAPRIVNHCLLPEENDCYTIRSAFNGGVSYKLLEIGFWVTMKT